MAVPCRYDREQPMVPRMVLMPSAEWVREPGVPKVDRQVRQQVRLLQQVRQVVTPQERQHSLVPAGACRVRRYVSR